MPALVYVNCPVAFSGAGGGFTPGCGTPRGIFCHELAHCCNSKKADDSKDNGENDPNPYQNPLSWETMCESGSFPFPW
jgi:hypothetical protein